MSDCKKPFFTVRFFVRISKNSDGDFKTLFFCLSHASWYLHFYLMYARNLQMPVVLRLVLQDILQKIAQFADIADLVPIFQHRIFLCGFLDLIHPSFIIIHAQIRVVRSHFPFLLVRKKCMAILNMAIQIPNCIADCRPTQDRLRISRKICQITVMVRVAYRPAVHID